MQINSAAPTAYVPIPRDTDSTTNAAATTPADAPADADQTIAPQADEPSSVKSFAYGALGLERPEVQATDTNGFYTAGKWVAAAATIGGIVSLFV
jgi:hypothetical protein